MRNDTLSLKLKSCRSIVNFAASSAACFLLVAIAGALSGVEPAIGAHTSLTPNKHQALRESGLCSSVDQTNATEFDLSPSQVAPPEVVLSEQELVNILNRQSSAPTFVSAYGLTMQLRSGHKVSADVVKIIETRDFPWPYVGVFHRFDRGDYFKTEMVASHDLRNWQHVRTISDRASMPDIRLLSDGAVLYAEERNPSGTRPFIEVSHFRDLQTFSFSGAASNTVALPKTKAAGADGTPSFRRIQYNGDFSKSKIEVTYHNFEGSVDDKNARGVLSGFANWAVPSKKLPINEVMRERGYKQVGGREVFRIGNTVYELLEARSSTRGSWADWRVFLINRCTGQLRRLAPRLVGGAVSIGNPKLSFLRLPNGQVGMVTSYFVFSEGSRRTPSGTHFQTAVLGVSVATN
jgi:hypothetical protein